MLPAPFGDRAVVAGGEDFGNGDALPLGRAGVLRIREEAADEGVLLQRLGRAEDAREEADDGIRHHRRRKLAAGEDVIADGVASHLEGVYHAVVDALVVPADEGERGYCGELAGGRLGEERAAGIGEDDGSGLETSQCRSDDIGLDHHAGTASVGLVVDGFVGVCGEIAHIDAVKLHDSRLLGALQHAVPNRREDGGREEGYEANPHGRTCPRADR